MEEELNKQTEAEQVETENVKCDSCGSNMKFDPASQMLYCEHCGRKESFATYVQADELAIENALGTGGAEWNDEAKVYRCENCGAKVVLDRGETASVCPFCGTAQVVESNELARLKPNALLPFKLTAEGANECCKRWAKKKIFAPGSFKKNLKAENIHGVYIPCFTFDSNTESIYSGRIGKRHTRTVGSGKNRRTETYIVWRNIGGNFSHFFDDVGIVAGSRVTQRDLEKMGPFDSNRSTKYDGKYLLGFSSYYYDKDISVCWGEAKQKMDAELKRLILSQYSYDVVEYFNIGTKHFNVTYKYVLLPVYAGHFGFRKKIYNFFVNGTNGRVTGKTPVAIWKVLLTVLVGLAVLTGLSYLIMQYL